MRVMKLAMHIVAVLFVAAVGAAPVSASGSDGPEEAQLLVYNQNGLDVVVYLVTDAGTRKKLGTVERLTSRMFAIPASFVGSGGEFRIKIYSQEKVRSPDGEWWAFDSRRLVAGVKTQPVSVEAGETIKLLAASPLTDSGIVIDE